MPHSISSLATLKVTPINHAPGSNVKFGVVIEGVDLNNVDDELFEELTKVIYTNELVIFKAQQALKPINHYEFVRRFDPAAIGIHGHGTLDTFKTKWKGAPNLLAAYSTHNIPEAPGVRLIAAGYQGKDHYGLKDIHFKTSSVINTHANPPSQEDIDAGFTRFGRWHIDCAMYNLNPPKITALRAITLPKGPDLTLRWDDGSGTEMKMKPGLTAFYSCQQQYEMFTPEECAIVDNSSVLYAPHPYQWISKCKQDSIGLSIPLGQGNEIPMDEMPPWEESKLKHYPMVWHNPITGKSAFMVHAIIVQKLFLKSAPDAEVKIVEDVDEVRKFLFGLMRRMVEPENVLIAPYEEGDVAVWNNRGMEHTFIEYPASYGPRTMHQVNIAASVPPT